MVPSTDKVILNSSSKRFIALLDFVGSRHLCGVYKDV